MYLGDVSFHDSASVQSSMITFLHTATIQSVDLQSCPVIVMRRYRCSKMPIVLLLRGVYGGTHGASNCGYKVMYCSRFGTVNSHAYIDRSRTNEADPDHSMNITVTVLCRCSPGSAPTGNYFSTFWSNSVSCPCLTRTEIRSTLIYQADGKTATRF